MTLKSIILIFFLYYAEAFALVISKNEVNKIPVDYFDEIDNHTEIFANLEADNTTKVFDGVYTECFLRLSYSCLQKKTLLYLKELDKLNEVSVIGDYVKFVKINDTNIEESDEKIRDSDELASKIDEAVDVFFNNHVLKFRAMGTDLAVPHSVDEFVGRKRKGGGGGGGGGHDHGGGDDGGKKKMMMMAMMCMKMKFMMMVPAMLGMMGMMSFKGMMFSMMSFMMAKMMLLMKILEKKGGGGGMGGGGWMDGGGGGGGWAAGGGGGGGGGAWMPAGGQDYGGGGGGGNGGGGYDANGQWQSRSIAGSTSEDTLEYRDDETQDPILGPFDEDIHGISDDFTATVQEKEELELKKPVISYVKPTVSFNNKANTKKPFATVKKLADEVIKIKEVEDTKTKSKSRKKRGIVDLLQNAYLYWINKVLTLNSYNKYYPRFPRYRIVNGVKYVYYPVRNVQSPKAPKDLKPISHQLNNINANLIHQETEGFKPIITAEEFNKGEIVEGPVESRMTKKLKDMRDTINEAIEGNEWQ